MFLGKKSHTFFPLLRGESYFLFLLDKGLNWYHFLLLDPDKKVLLPKK